MNVQSSNTFEDYTKEVVSKYFKKQNLIDHIESDYHYFLTNTLKDYYEDKRYPIDLASPKEDKPYEYYLHFKKYFLDHDYRVFNGKRQVYPIDLSIQKKQSRQINVYVYVDVIEKDLSTNVETVITKQKQPLLFCKIPLLINSRYDMYAKKGLYQPYYFLINGTSKILNNILINNPYARIARNLKIEDSSVLKTTSKLSKTAFRDKELRLNYDPRARRFNLYLYNNKPEVGLFDVLRFLKVSTEEILKVNDNIVSEVEILEGLLQSYNKPFSELCESIMKTIYSEEDLASIQKEDYEPLLKEYFSTNLCWDSSGEPEHLWMYSKKIDLLSLLKQTIVENKQLTGIYSESLAYKKIFTLKDHLNKIVSTSMTTFLERAKIIFLKQMNVLKRSKSVNIFTAVDISKKVATKYFVRGNSKTFEPYSEYIIYSNKSSVVSSQRKIITNLNKDVWYAQHRTINPSKYGRTCPVQSPYSKNVGLVQYLAVGAKCSSDSTNEVLKELQTVQKTFLEDYSKHPFDISIFINNRFFSGLTKENLSEFLSKLAKLKRKVGLSYNYDDKTNKVDVRCTSGRLLKPFYIVDKGRVNILKYGLDQICDSTIDDLVKTKCLIYLDTLEESDKNITISDSFEDLKDTQYLIISPSLDLSYAANKLPLVSLNTGNRSSLACRLVDQSIGFKLRKDTFEFNETNIEYLTAPDVSILTTEAEQASPEILGQNTIITYSHGNIREDSLELNRSCIQRGLFNSIIEKRKVYQTIPYDAKKFKPTDVVDQEKQQTKVDPVDGLPKVNQICDESIVLRTVNDSNFSTSKHYSPISPFYIKEVYYNCSAEKTDLEVVYSKLRGVKPGDKFGTRNGIKGVASSSIPQYEDWISESGTYAAMRISTHVINSRMILAPLAEVLLSKASVLEGKQRVVSPFTCGKALQDIVQESIAVLRKNNLSEDCKDRFFCTKTKRYCDLNTGPSKILFLIHHARDKQYLRTDKGGVDPLTRQPGAGRVVQGGIRFGEMECNSAIEHCAINFLKDKLNIDTIKVPVCKCGEILDYSKSGVQCTLCKQATQYTLVDIPYVFLVFTKILKSCHINTKVSLTKNNVDEEEDASAIANIDSEELNSLVDEDALEEEAV